MTCPSLLGVSFRIRKSAYFSKWYLPMRTFLINWSLSLCDKADAPEQAGGDGMDLVEVLHLEAVPVFGDERLVVMRRERGPGIDRGVVDADLDVVAAGFEVGADGEPVRRMPERAGALTIDENDGGFPDGRVVLSQWRSQRPRSVPS